MGCGISKPTSQAQLAPPVARPLGALAEEPAVIPVPVSNFQALMPNSNSVNMSAGRPSDLLTVSYDAPATPNVAPLEIDAELKQQIAFWEKMLRENRHVDPVFPRPNVSELRNKLTDNLDRPLEGFAP